MNSLSIVIVIIVSLLNIAGFCMTMQRLQNQTIQNICWYDIISLILVMILAFAGVAIISSSFLFLFTPLDVSKLPKSVYCWYMGWFFACFLVTAYTWFMKNWMFMLLFFVDLTLALAFLLKL